MSTDHISLSHCLAGLSQELRFIIYVFPIVTLSAAVACDRLWRSKSLQSLMRLGLVGALAVSLLASSVFMAASMYNYPGTSPLSLLRLSAVEWE